MRYPPNFVQHIDPQALTAGFARFATYEGDAPDLKHLSGVLIPIEDVEKVVYVGERENVWTTTKDGDRVRPWVGVYIDELDGGGNSVVSGYGGGGGAPKRGPGAMSRGELNALGMTENELIDHAKNLLGVVYEPDRSGPSDLRRSIYQRVAEVLFKP